MTAPAAHLAPAQLAALHDCAPTLCRFPKGWKRAPQIGGAYHSAATVRGLITAGYLETGGEGWLRLTTKGKQAIGAAA